MQAILREDVDGLGRAGTVVNVARGYLRNYLLPRGLAEQATPGRVAEIERQQAQRRQAELKAVEQSKELAALLGRTILTLKAKAGGDGRLFGSITAGDVADAIHEARGVRVDRRAITVDPPIRAVGTYTVPVTLGPDLVAEVKTIVSPLIEE
ncbi:MAG: 50S ribosomal protein L9 [Actinomycetota bacterium]